MGIIRESEGEIMNRVQLFISISLMAVLITPTLAVDLNDGGYYFVDDNRYPEDVFLDDGVINNPGTHLELTTNGLINGYIIGFNYSKVTVSGGSTSGVWLTDNSTATLSTGDIGGSIIANGTSEITINEVTTYNDIEAKDFSQITMNGGGLGGHMKTFTDGFIYLHGNFSVDGQLLGNGDSLRDYGTVYSDGDGEWLTGTITGRLSDGSVVNNEFHVMTLSNYGPWPNGDIIITQSLPALTITSPQGGESFHAGQQMTINWQGADYISNVELAYSIDAGQNWTSIATVPNLPGAFSWVVPQVNSQQCLIRILDTDVAGVFDDSTQFTIYICTLNYDLNNDCVVNIGDMALLASEWLQSGNPFE